MSRAAATTGHAYSYRAAYVFPVFRPPIQDGVITIAGERIASLGTGSTHGPVEDLTEQLGRVALLPGLVNAHTHLEFSDLTAPLAPAGTPFPEWIRRVVEHRRRQSRGLAASRSEALTHAVTRGLIESRRSGVTLLGDITTDDWQSTALPRTSLDCTLFRERIGWTVEAAEAGIAASRQWLERPRAPGWAAGLSPHAPYTVHRRLLEGLCKLACEFNVPVAMHLAESREELELLREGRGRLVDCLDSLGAWIPGRLPLGLRPLVFLKTLAETPRALVVHGNYLDSEEVEFLAGQSRVTVVYCPRTHAFFGHDRYLLREYLDAGVRVALGTDSRASNPDLAMWDEWRFAARRHADVSPATMLAMATRDAARSLGHDDQGTLQPGQWANMIAVTLPDHAASDPHQLLLDANSLVAATWSRGERSSELGL